MAAELLMTVLVGNSNVRWIRWNGDTPEAAGVIAVGELHAEAPSAAFTQGLSGAWVVAASVNAPAAERVGALCAAAGSACEWFGDARPIPLPLSPAMSDPDGIGIDRLVAAYAAWRLTNAPVIVVDVGTAITVNAVDARGEFVGGAIAIGPHLAAQALAGGTDQLPVAPVTPTARALGRNTHEALAAGVSIGLAGLVRELVAAAHRELGGDRCPVIATGGGLGRLTGLDGVIDRVEPDLALIGLRLAAEAAPPDSA